MYPQAKGHMLDVWATCECPICGEDMRSSSYDYEVDDEHGKLFTDTYACDYCEILLTYISPADMEYHDVLDSQKWYLVERMI